MELVTVSCGEVHELVGRLSGPSSSLFHYYLGNPAYIMEPIRRLFLPVSSLPLPFSFLLSFLPQAFFGQDGLCASCDSGSVPTR